MTPQMEAALRQPKVTLLGLLEITFPNYTLRLCDGSATVTWGAKVFASRDALFGTIGEIEAIDEQTGDVMPGLDVTLFPPSLSAAVSLSNPSMQGSLAMGWLAAVDATTGAVIPDPDLLFAGEVDVPVLDTDQGYRAITIQIASVFERLMEPDEGVRLADSFHQHVWPGELGLANMTGTAIDRLWGPGDKPPSYTMVSQEGGGSSQSETLL